MSSLRLPGNQEAVDVEQHAFAQSRAGRNHRDVAGRHALACLQHRQLVSLQDRDAIRHRFEIVEQTHAAEVGGAARSAASMHHGTLVSWATWLVTAPATPNDAASI